MPLDPATLTLSAIVAAAVATVTLLAETAVPDGAILVTPEVIEILTHKTLRLYCLLGAIGGGIMAVLLMGQAGAREMAAKWTVGVLSGVLFTPWLIRACGIVPLSDNIAALAGLVALLSWGCLHKLLPVLERIFVGRVRRIVGDSSDPTPPAKP